MNHDEAMKLLDYLKDRTAHMSTVNPDEFEMIRDYITSRHECIAWLQTQLTELKEKYGRSSGAVTDLKWQNESIRLKRKIHDLEQRLSHYERDCEACGGDGKIYDTTVSSADYDVAPAKPANCLTCEGTGKRPVYRVPDALMRIIIEKAGKHIDKFWYRNNYKTVRAIEIGNIHATREPNGSWVVEEAE